MRDEPVVLRPDCIDRASNVIIQTFLRAVQADVVTAARAGGVHAVLAYLNARTRFRFTGICPSTAGTRSTANADATRRIYLYDRDFAAVAATSHRALEAVAAAMEAVRRDGGSGVHPESCAHAASCLGASLVDANGAVWGTLCHFDHRLRTAPPSERMVLRHVGCTSSAWLSAAAAAAAVNAD